MYTIQRGKERHYIQEGNELIAEMTFSQAGDSAIIIDSTYVREANRGEGLGMALLDSVVEMARAEGRKIVPLCPFAKAQFEKYDKYQDVYANGKR